MRRIRNPRYAPELLERKLFPSDLTGLLPPPAPVEVAAADATVAPLDVVPAPPADSALPADSLAIDYPPPPPPPPAGPTGPAVTGLLSTAW